MAGREPGRGGLPPFRKLWLFSRYFSGIVGTLGLDEVELLIVLLRELLKELRVLGKELSVLGSRDSVDADVDRL